MIQARPELFFDFIDPLSFLMAQELASVPAIGPSGFDWIPVELRPPPAPLTTLDDPDLAERWRRAHAEAGSYRTFAPPSLVPWTRKAHELVRHAAESGRAERVRERVFEAYLFEGRDIGRVDVLVEVARACGLDATETKAVLDVDRYEEEVATRRAEALDAGADAPPCLRVGDALLRGFHNASAIRTFLGT